MVQKYTPLGSRVLVQGWFWALTLVPIAYFVLVRQTGILDRDAFLLATVLSGAVGAFIVLLWKIMSRGEVWFQVGSFLFNVLFAGYFIALSTR